MTCCCCPQASGIGRLFSFLSKRHRKRYEKKGFEDCQLQLLSAIEAAGIGGASLLEIGSGVGHLHQTLLQRGAESAVGVDLAEKMLQEARESAEKANLSDRTHYVQADFVAAAAELAEADITILDKVVCCYPDADGLVHQSLAKTRRVYALTYPRDRWYTRLFVRVGNGLMWLIRSDYRSFVHDPEMVTGWITAAGFERRQQALTWFWRTESYVRTMATPPG